jgi:predicted RNase H-like nuclease (RuvC/YqgF family)
MKENMNANNRSMGEEKSIDLMNKILQEKESYINKLEIEISEMRREIDQLKDKLITVEINGLDKTSNSIPLHNIGGNTTSLSAT